MAGGTTTNELQSLGDQIFLLHRLPVLFLGVSPSDCLPSSMLKCTNPRLTNGKSALALCCILNVEPVFMGGSHWVAFFREANSYVMEFFDSFGYPPSFYGFHLQENTRVFNHYHLQSNESVLCGEYSLIFLFLRSRLLMKTNATVLASHISHRFNLSCNKIYFLGKDFHSRDSAIRSLIKTLCTKS